MLVTAGSSVRAVPILCKSCANFQANSKCTVWSICLWARLRLVFIIIINIIIILQLS
jgi:hypothetical protein